MDMRNVILLLVSVVVSLSILEAGLREFTPFPIHGGNANKIAHPVLGYTLDPSGYDIDAAGFRNPSSSGTFDIVTLGDSHTQGFNVRREESWPYQLAGILGKEVYNYGVGSYGIYQYAWLSDHVMEKQPAVVLLGLFPGNDISSHASRWVPDDYLQSIHGISVDHQGTEKEVFETDNGGGLDEPLKSRSAILSFASYLNKKRKSELDKYMDIGGQLIRIDSVVGGEKSRDLSNPEVQENFNNGLVIIGGMADMFRGKGVGFGVLIIPSKELVVYEWAGRKGIPKPELFDVPGEQSIIRQYATSLEQMGIHYIDATPWVTDALERDENEGRVFYPHGDSHPIQNGYRSYAEAAAVLYREIVGNL